MAQPPTKKLKTSISSFSQPIKITVGPSRTEFHIPKDLLQSEVSQLPLLLDTESNTIKLPREDPDVFVLFATWLTRGSIELCSEFLNLDNLCSSSAKDAKEAAALKTQRLDQWHQLVNAYILGDLLGSVAFKNTVMDLLVDKAQVVAKENKMAAEMQHRSLSLIYDSTEAGSPLRRLAVQIGLNHLNLNDLPAGIAGAFWAELAKSAVPLFRISESGHDVSTGPWALTMDKSLFHEKHR